MPLGATPSRWCVCQFHHFRALNYFAFNYLMDSRYLLLAVCSSLILPLHRTFGQKLCASGSRQLGKERLDGVSPRVGERIVVFDVIVTRRVLQCERIRILPTSAKTWARL